MEVKGQHVQDSKTMQAMVKKGVATAELQCINQCWMWLQVHYISKICMGDGSQITQMAWEGMEETQLIYEWPRMQKPTQTEWRIWQ